jgi:hypothetical protein
MKETKGKMKLNSFRIIYIQYLSFPRKHHFIRGGLKVSELHYTEEVTAEELQRTVQ